MANKTINILVTGVGAIIGYGILKCLKKSIYNNLKIIGTDIYKDAVGQAWCDKFIRSIRADSKDFINFINNLILKENIHLLIPGTEQELEVLVGNFKKLPKHTRYILNNKNLFGILHDKYKTYNFLEHHIPLIPNINYSDKLYEESVKKFGLPFILKQNISYASKGIAIIESKKDYIYYINIFGKNCMAQKKMDIGDSEYTCSVFGLGDGSFVNPICLKRELSQEGATKKATNISIDDELRYTLEKITKKCNFEGPTNLQFIKNNGKYYLLEINARISSSTSIREIFGINEAEMCIEFYMLNQIPKKRITKYGTVIRYIEDLYFDSNIF